jgi:hypothetical protein
MIYFFYYFHYFKESVKKTSIGTYTSTSKLENGLVTASLLKIFQNSFGKLICIKFEKFSLFDVFFYYYHD